MTSPSPRATLSRAALGVRLLLGLALASSAAHASDWPTYQANLARSGISPDPLPPSLVPLWTWRSPHPPQPAWQGEAKWDGWNKVYDLKPRQIFDRAFHPVFAQGRVLFGSSADDQLHCLDARTGDPLWTFYTEGPIRFAPMVAGDRVYFGSDDGQVYCVNATDGQLVWSRRIGPEDRRIPGNGRIISAWPVRTSVLVQDERVYATAGMFPSETVHLVALDARTGDEVWHQTQRDLPAQGYLLASRSRLYVPAGRNNPVVCDLATGKRERVVEGAGGTYALLTGDSLVFGPGKTGQLGMVDENQSDQLASFQGHHLIVTGDRSYLQSDTEITAIDRARYLDLARQRKQLSSKQGPLVKKLRDLEKKKTAAADLVPIREQIADLGQQIDKTSAAMQDCRLWTVPCQWPDSMILAGDTLVVGGANETAAFAVAGGQRLWTLPVEGRAYGLATAEGRLWIATDLGVLHCLGNASLRAAR
ncbi:MAG: PQQ-like beta-propeller repeat protein [Verrucomicrobiales bacterium]|nr:PQQ-like beta-propeller repeat protein [Verrucomicrobiales bacterium]